MLSIAHFGLPYIAIILREPRASFDVQGLSLYVGVRKDDKSDDDDDNDTVASPHMSTSDLRMKKIMRVVNTAMYDNPLAQLYRRAFDDLADAPEAHLRIHTDPSHRPAGGAAAGAHERQYNAPTAGNVAVILHAPCETNYHDVIVHRKDVPLLTSTSKQVTVYDNGCVNGQKVSWLTPVPKEGTYAIISMGDGTINTTVELRDNSKFKNPASGLRRVPYTNSHYDALAFPLFFHRGTQTWGNGFEAHTHIWPISNSYLALSRTTPTLL